MMSELIVCQGLPASGKSTWAKKRVEEGNGHWKRFNKDDLRSMIDLGKWSGKNEKLVLAIQEYGIREALSRGFSVIVDDTNLSVKMVERYARISAECDVDLKWKTFLHVPVEECIKRDKNRTSGYVGAGVINNMAKQYKEWYGKNLPICPTCGDEIISPDSELYDTQINVCSNPCHIDPYCLIN